MNSDKCGVEGAGSIFNSDYDNKTYKELMLVRDEMAASVIYRVETEMELSDWWWPHVEP